LSELALYFHTIRHLRPIQIAARIWQQVYRPRPDLRPAAAQRPLAASYVAPVPALPTLVGPDTFRLLNVEQRCATAADWSPPAATKLWRYHLHYFDDLNAWDSCARADWHQPLLERWVKENPPGAGDGWEPYPVSRRVVNWIKWAARDNALPGPCHTSLAVQTRWLCGRLEYQLLGNHLLANAKALVHAGLYFEGTEAERWYRRGIDIVEQQLGEQVLADGGHFELTPMYHALVLEDLLDLINLLSAYGRSPRADWYAAVARMRRWLLTMSHPDGDISFFNDATLGVAASPAELEAYARRLGLGPCPVSAAPLEVLRESGYVRASAGPAYLICDCAEVGPDYLPGHAHADTLSFELSLAGNRVLVNSGVSEYGNQAERQRQRGTAAHNTVIVNGQNSSETWDGFRVARRARALLRDARGNGTIIIEGCHDGYARLPGRNRHTRRWILDRHSLRIEDLISGEFQHAEARLHLHPAVDVHISTPERVTLYSGGHHLAILHFRGAASVEVARSTWHAGFGVSVENTVVTAGFKGASLSTDITWAGLR
jgi:uncharacterized heparinase superfamily protein